MSDSPTSPTTLSTAVGSIQNSPDTQLHTPVGQQECRGAEDHVAGLFYLVGVSDDGFLTVSCDGYHFFQLDNLGGFVRS
ncbi:hypothetical protein RRG08_064337 [Elysia crispata]|uniref:Uncharacterized protein n=1 Tax=Elysia crispata TaxID=231223 RepID=A0AAE0ZJE5_9GAST|nr:hypothetical protein RRG08_064337 [Elysia crispata]